MPETVRTFIAVETSETVRQRAVELIGVFSTSGAKVSWVKPHSLHLTLKFLGEVPLNSIAQIDAAVRRVAQATEPFELEIRKAGAFPSAGRPRTVWLAAGDGGEALGKLQATLEGALKPIGFPKEHRRYAAHLTIGRVRQQCPASAELGRLIKQHADFIAGRFSVAELIVFSSQLTPQGPIYEALGRAGLGKR